ncbi:MAG: cyclic pyranopterin monophosphate synthase MoaC [Promethearchaeota archaeon]
MGDPNTNNNSDNLPYKIDMVDISNKKEILRIATASGKIYLKEKTIEAIKSNNIKKGNPIETAKIVALIAVKKTPELIPHCHQIPITKISFDHKFNKNFIEMFVTVKAIARTGVEMEALVGISTMLNVIWDMTKYLEKDEDGQYPNTKINDIQVINKKKIEIN